MLNSKQAALGLITEFFSFPTVQKTYSTWVKILNVEFDLNLLFFFLFSFSSFLKLSPSLDQFVWCIFASRRSVSFFHFCVCVFGMAAMPFPCNGHVLFMWIYLQFFKDALLRMANIKKTFKNCHFLQCNHYFFYLALCFFSVLFLFYVLTGSKSRRNNIKCAWCI